MELVRLAFWIGMQLAGYAYVGYGICVWLLGCVRPRPARSADITPSVTLVIPCYKETSWIAQKIENSLHLDYPDDRLELIVVLDGPDDESAAIVARYADRNVRCLVQAVRSGKEAAMQRGARAASGEILIFTDANAMLNREALRLLVRWFADPRVGAVAGEKRVVDDDQQRPGRGEGLYWRYESELKKLDSLVGSTMGATGELIAIRTSLMRYDATDDIIEDFVLSMRLVEAGYRVVYEPGATVTEDSPATHAAVFERRARIAAGGFQALWRLRSLLNPAYGIVWWQYVSHRVLRWALVPFLLPILLLLNGALARTSATYRALFVVQLAIYVASVVGLVARETRLGALPIFYYPYFFVSMNVAVVAGLVRLLTGRQTVLWRRTR